MVEKQIEKRAPAFLMPTRSKKISQQSSSKIGTYKNEVTMELARKFPDRQLTPRNIAKVQYGRASKQNEEYVRRRLWLAYTDLQNAGELWYPIYDSKCHGELLAIKQYRADAVDAESFPVYLNRALSKREITKDHADKLESLKAIIDVNELTAEV